MRVTLIILYASIIAVLILIARDVGITFRPLWGSTFTRPERMNVTIPAVPKVEEWKEILLADHTVSSLGKGQQFLKDIHAIRLTGEIKEGKLLVNGKDVRMYVATHDKNGKIVDEWRSPKFLCHREEFDLSHILVSCPSKYLEGAGKEEFNLIRHLPNGVGIGFFSVGSPVKVILKYRGTVAVERFH